MADIELILGADNGHANKPDELWEAYPKVNRNFDKINKEITRNKVDIENKLEAHKNSITAHPAEHVPYSGDIIGANNVKEALDNTKRTIDDLILGSGDSGPEVAAARGGHTTLGDRLDASDVYLAEKADKSEVDAINTELSTKADQSDLLNVERLSKTDAIYQRAINAAKSPRNSLAAAKTAIAAGSLKIVFVGDSITENGDVQTADNYVQRVTNELKTLLPFVTITPVNYALSSRTASNLADPNYLAINPEPADKSGFWRPWATAGKSWIHHVRDANPDLIVLTFGINDAFGGSVGKDATFQTAIKNIVDASKSWTKVPSIILTTNTMTINNTAIYNQSQAKTIAVARAGRAYANSQGIAVADVNRLYLILRDGADDVSRDSLLEQNWAGWNDGKWIGSTNFTLNSNVLTVKLTDKGYQVQNNSPFYDGSIELDIYPKSASPFWLEYRLSQEGLGQINVLFTPNTSGTNGVIRIYYNITGSSVQIGSINGVNIPQNVWTRVKIEANGANHKVYLAGSSTPSLDVTTYYCMHDGAVRMGLVGAGITADMRNLNLVYCNPLSGGAGLYTELELLGPLDDPIASGNGINHPSSLTHAMAFVPAFSGIFNDLCM